MKNSTIKILVLIGVLTVKISSIIKKPMIYYSSIMDGLGFGNSFYNMKGMSFVVTFVVFLIVSFFVCFFKMGLKEQNQEKQLLSEKVKSFVEDHPYSIISTIITLVIFVITLYLGIDFRMLPLNEFIKILVLVFPYYSYINAIISTQVILCVLFYYLLLDFIKIIENKE